jgi:DUF1009 family protein
MINQDKIKYGFIIGKDDLVPQVLQKAQDKQLDFVVAAIKSVSSRLIVNKYNHFWFNLGEISFLIDNLKKQNVSHIVLVGSLSRPSFFNLKTDALGKKFIKDNFKEIFGDNSLLSLVIKTFEDHGFIVVGLQTIDESVLCKKGLLTTTQVPQQSITDVENGFAYAKKFSQFDVGQSIIFQQNIAIAIEAVEGTANLIKRSKKIIKKQGPQALLIKVAKTLQDERVDLPTIGIRTINSCKSSKICGIVIEANKTILLNPKAVIDLADKYKIFIIAI